MRHAPASRRAERRRRDLARIVAATLVLAAVALAGCSSDGDPAAAARRHLRNRIAATGTAAQARCVVGQLDDDQAIALDREADLPPDSDAMKAYSDAMVACIAGL